MTTLRRELLNYAEFLRACGNLYVESGREGAGRTKEEPREPEAPPPPDVRLAEAGVEGALREPMAGSSEGNLLMSSRETGKASPSQLDFFDTAEPPKPLDAEDLSEAERQARVTDAMAVVEACTACELCHGRARTVYSDGSVMARIVFVGEAPGAEEDRTGIPFVGRAGKLLTKMIAAIGFEREEVYICNMLKCRPPGNRDPLPSEKKTCEQFLIQQIQWIRPQILVGLGAHASAYLTGQETSIGKMRKRWHSFRGIPVLATYHPAFLLRSPSFKKTAWEDMLMLSERYAELNPGDKRKVWRGEW